MSDSLAIRDVDLASLKVIHYPDPRLQIECDPVEVVDESLCCLAERMVELMFEYRGVGLAAPQVGLTIRMFIASPSFEPDDVRAYINPTIISTEGSQDGDEGCLSFPGISCNVKRPNIATIRATDLDGETFEETGEGLAARIFLHECDHLDGRLLIDRMGSVAKLANRKLLKELEQEFQDAQA